MQKTTLKSGQLLWSYVGCEAHRAFLLRSRWKWLIGILALWLSAASLALSGDNSLSTGADGSTASVLISGPAAQTGQSATQLPDGNWLLLGGQDRGNNASSDAVILNSKTGEKTPLNAKLAQARSEHTATLLPEGTVLILGGVDSAGVALTVAEQFDPTNRQFTVLGNLGLIGRAGHTATILTDGSLLISGGLDQHGNTVYESEIYHPNTRRVEHFSIKLDTARTNHLAALLPSADVLLWGGLNNDRKKLDNGEVYVSVQPSHLFSGFRTE